METWSLFSVTPVGLVLVASGIIYFVLAGRFVLPAAVATEDGGSKGSNTMDYFQEVYGVDYDLFEVLDQWGPCP